MRARIYAAFHKPNLCCQQPAASPIRMLNFVSSVLLTYFLRSLGVQSSPLHSVIIETFQVLSTLYLNKCCIISMANGDLCQWIAEAGVCSVVVANGGVLLLHV